MTDKLWGIPPERLPAWVEEQKRTFPDTCWEPNPDCTRVCILPALHHEPHPWDDDPMPPLKVTHLDMSSCPICGSPLFARSPK